jgi:signal transduction histidine kinase/CheY-like chemotaxis protein
MRNRAPKWRWNWAWAGVLLVLCLSVWQAVVYLRGGTVIRGREYTIGYNSNPPLQIRTREGEAKGFAVEVVSAAARRLGIRLRWVYDPTSTGEKLRNGEVDLWPLYADLPERRSFAYVSDPWMISDNFLLMRGSEGKQPARDFAGGIWYSGPGLYRKLILSKWPKAVLHPVSEPGLLYQPLCSGEYPLVFASSHQTNVMLREFGRLCPETAVGAHHTPELSSRLGVASRHEYAAVADALRAEVLQMGESGELGDILARYAYVGLTEMRTILHLVTAERQARMLKFALAGLVGMLAILGLLLWRLRRARRLAELASVSKGQFLANMSHEIRTPLGGVIGMVDLALEGPLSEEQRQHLQTAESSARSLLVILNDILDFSKIEAGRLELSPTAVGLSELVREVAKLMEPVAAGKGLELKVELDPAVPRSVFADPVRVKQVLLNLCGNAIKFTSQGSVAIRVWLDDRPVMRESGQLMLQFSVTDTGIGIPAHQAKRLFQAFEQVDGSIARQYGGTGLGLVISKHLVEMMGGRIWFESQAGTGSTFTFSICVPSVGVAARRAGSVAEKKKEEGAAVRPLRVLLAEDNPVNQKVVGTMLRRDGHEVTVVGCGKEAVAAIELGALYDAVLMDIQMPEMDGLEATAAIRGLEGSPMRRVPILALTAHAMDGYDKTCLEAGMDGYLSKPLDRDQLRRELAGIAARVPERAGMTEPQTKA